MATGTDLIAEARKLVGCSFYHMGRGPHCYDCIGLILAPAYRLGITRFQPATYSPGGDTEYLMECLQSQCVPVEAGMQPGDIAAFRIRRQVQHLAYLTGTGSMLHARERIGCVESFIDDRWQERIAGVWRWRALTDE